jgi:hypothetical protein
MQYKKDKRSYEAARKRGKVYGKRYKEQGFDGKNGVASAYKEYTRSDEYKKDFPGPVTSDDTVEAIRIGFQNGYRSMFADRVAEA